MIIFPALAGDFFERRRDYPAGREKNLFSDGFLTHS
jgi:hypothetical protein